MNKNDNCVLRVHACAALCLMAAVLHTIGSPSFFVVIIKQVRWRAADQRCARKFTKPQQGAYPCRVFHLFLSGRPAPAARWSVQTHDRCANQCPVCAAPTHRFERPTGTSVSMRHTLSEVAQVEGLHRSAYRSSEPSVTRFSQVPLCSCVMRLC